MCYDISRAAEEIFYYLGFEVRHVSVYKNTHNNRIKTLLSRGSSHALLEIKSEKGWLAIDPHMGIVYTDAHNNPIATEEILKSKQSINEQRRIHQIFQDNYVIVCGLYSRHGKFYKPFTPLPDVSWQQFLATRNTIAVNK